PTQLRNKVPYRIEHARKRRSGRTGGIGTTDAFLVIARREYADASIDRAFSLAKTSILTVWNVTRGVVALAINGISEASENILRCDRTSAETQAEDPNE
ncbi:MAG TPA: hypothetical protein VFS96_09540, partial [Nitrolancea sp.]|nr:hypothetical protein [Nitrolancea sp.]